MPAAAAAPPPTPVSDTMATETSWSQAGPSTGPRRSERKPLKPWLAALVLVALSFTAVDGQLAHNQVIPPGQKRPDLISPTKTAAIAATATKSRKQSAADKKHSQKQQPSGKKIHPTYDRTQVYHGPHDSSVVQQLAPTTTWRPRPTHHSSPSGRPSSKDHSPPEPPKAFAYLEDIGIAPDVPFISGMRPAGQTWNDAGLRPNVDPRLKSPFRKDADARRKNAKAKKGKAKVNHAHQSAFGTDDGKKDSVSNIATALEDSSEHDNYAFPIAEHQPKWKLRPEQPDSPSQSDDAEAAAVADEWAESESADIIFTHGQDRATQATENQVAASKAGTAAAAAAAAGYDSSPSIVKFTNSLVGSGKKVWKWIKTGGREKDGIALTMLQPKVHRPVVARLPMIPNDAKRDFVLLIIATIAGVSMLAFLWSSRVSPEEFQKVKRMKEYVAANPRSRIQGYDDYEDGVTAGASSSRLQPTGRRRNTASSASGRRLGSDDLGVASEESDSEVARAILSRNNTHRNRRFTPPVHMDNQRGSVSGRLRSWLNFVPWSSSGTKSDGSIALPLLSEFSRSATPSRIADHRDDDRDLATGPPSAGMKWSIPSLSRSSSSTLLPSLARSLTDVHGSGVGNSGGASFLSKSPLRSVTPQPQTQRQRERERSRERRRKIEQARWEAEQARIRIGPSVAGPSSLRRDSVPEGGSSGTPSGGEMEDFEYFTRRVDYDDVDIDAIESGLPSRAASANSFRSWRGPANERSAFSQAIAPFSSVKPLTSREGTQQGSDNRPAFVNADSPYASVDLQSPSRTSGSHSHSHGPSSSLSSTNSASSHSSYAGSSLLHVPDQGSQVASSATDGSSPGWDSGGSTPRATSLRRPAKQNGSDLPEVVASTSAVEPIAGDETVTDKGLGKQRALH